MCATCSTAACGVRASSCASRLICWTWRETARSGLNVSTAVDDKVFEFQDRISASMLGSLEPRLRAVEAARAGERPTESLDAYDCVLKAMSRLYRFTDESYRETRELLERAIKLDPAYAQAHAYRRMAAQFPAWRVPLRPIRSPIPSARARCVPARAGSGSRGPFRLVVAAHLNAFLTRRLDHASDLFDRALSLDENSAFAWGLSALTRAYLGRPDEALERLQNLWRLNPFDPLNFYFWIVAGIAEFVAGRYDEFDRWPRKCKSRESAFHRLFAHAGGVAGAVGRRSRRKGCRERLLAIEPSFRFQLSCRGIRYNGARSCSALRRD